MKSSNEHKSIGKSVLELCGKIIKNGGERFEKVVALQFFESLCLPYLENLTITKKLPAHFTGK